MIVFLILGNDLRLDSHRAGNVARVLKIGLVVSPKDNRC